MELPNLLKVKKDPQTSKYLAIEIGVETVRTATWEVIGQNPQIIQHGSVETVDPQNPKALLNAIDASLAQALEGIDPEPDKTVFSLPETWINQGNIAPDKKQLLRYICEKMELQALGFVVTLEAIVYFLEIKKGHPPSVIIIGISNEDAHVSLVQNGTVVGTQTVGRSDDIGSDIREGIARFEGIKMFPSHMVLFDGLSSLDQIQQELIEFDWQDGLPFMHIPKIDRLTTSEILEGVVNTAGLEVIKNFHQPAGSKASKNLPEVDETETEAGVPDKQAEFGFVVSHPHKDKSESDLDELETTNIDDIDEADDNIVPVEDLLPMDVEDDYDDDDVEEEIESGPGLLERLGGLLPFRRAKTADSSIKIPSNTGRKKLITLLVGGILLLVLGLVGSVAAYWYLPTADVTLIVSPREINRSLDFSVSTLTTDLNLEESILPGVLVETDVTAFATTPATGKKLVGEKAKGEVTLFNRTNSTKTFEAGTTLTGPDGKVYTISEDVTIASASSKENADFSVTTEPAKVSVNIAANTIGADYNLDAGAEFTVANFDKSSYVAKAEKAIGGGTSREITAVDQADINTIRSQVKQEIESKLLAQVNQSQEDFTGAVILSDKNDTLVEEFSAQLGEEATEVNLNASTNVRSVTYKKSDLLALIKAQFSQDIPESFELSTDDMKVEVTSVDETDEEVIGVSAKINLLASPEIDTSEIASRIRGKFPQVTYDYFQTIPGFQRVEIDIRPNLPESIKTFPKIEEKINVFIEVDKE